MSRGAIFRAGSIFKSLVVMFSLVALAGGVGFAALQSPSATLTGNSIHSATADLRIGTSASSFAATRSGFDFADVVPGGPAKPEPGQSFWLKNYGTATMGVKMSIGSVPVNTSSVDLSKVYLVITRQDTLTAQTFTVQSLVDAHPAGNAITEPINPSAVVEYKLQVKMDADAMTGSGAAITGIDLVFNGAAVN